MARRTSRSKTPQRSAAPSRAAVPAAPVQAFPGATAPRTAAPSLQRARRLGHSLIQAKLTLGPADDVYERQADATARQVMQQISGGGGAGPAVEADAGTEASAQRDGVPQEDELEGMVAPKRVQRDSALPFPDEDEGEVNLKRVQRSASAEGGALDSGIEGRIDSARSGGRTLDESVRGKMEPAFGADFGGVKVHTDANAHQLNHSLQARAFTTGSDIFFRKGEYSPGSSSGQELLAHELTHVVQQGAAQTKRDG